MTNFTHAFILDTKQTITVEELREIVDTVEVRVKGFWLISDLDKVVYDPHGRPSRNAGGWSYGHTQHGWICAGAGGLNSMQVLKIK